MLSKRNLFLALIGLLIVGGISWYAYKNNSSLANQGASVLDGQNRQNSSSDFSVLENEIVFGSPNAPVTMVEYSSYSCPHCARFQKQTLPKIMENYVETGQVRLVIRRVSSPALSVAAVCADKQREFKEIDNYLFENVDDLHREVEGIENQNRIQNIVSGWVEKMAKDTGINESQFRQCLNSEDSLKTVRHWLDKVEKKQIDATPAFFVNDRQISGNQQYFKFEQVIEQALQL